jgi:class 3 adenylate cyclase
LIEIDDLKTVFHLERLRLDVIRPIAESHGADIVRNYGGDGLVISFAEPVLAVRCAISLQEHVKSNESSWSDDEQIRFRIGIAMGPVLLVNGNLHGGAINVAARLQALAEPGGIWATEPVIRQVQADVPFEALGELQLRNIAQRINAYRINPNVANLENSCWGGRCSSSL